MNSTNQDLSPNETNLLKALVRSSFTSFRLQYAINYPPLIFGSNGVPIAIDDIDLRFLSQSIQQLSRKGFLLTDQQNHNIFHLTELGLEFVQSEQP